MNPTTRISKSITILIAAMLASSSCLFDNSGVDEEVWPVPAISIQDIELNQNKITFDVLLGVPSSGWQIASPRTEHDNYKYHVQFMGIPPNDPGLPIMSSLDTRITLDVVPGSTYTFNFWRLNEVPLDTTISIPN